MDQTAQTDAPAPRCHMMRVKSRLVVRARTSRAAHFAPGRHPEIPGTKPAGAVGRDSDAQLGAVPHRLRRERPRRSHQVAGRPRRRRLDRRVARPRRALLQHPPQCEVRCPAAPGSGCRAGVFRRSFWDEFGLRFEADDERGDVDLMVHALLASRSLDVVPAVVYRWFSRTDKTEAFLGAGPPAPEAAVPLRSGYAVATRIHAARSPGNLRHRRERGRCRVPPTRQRTQLNPNLEPCEGPDVVGLGLLKARTYEGSESSRPTSSDAAAHALCRLPPGAPAMPGPLSGGDGRVGPALPHPHLRSVRWAKFAPQTQRGWRVQADTPACIKERANPACRMLSMLKPCPNLIGESQRCARATSSRHHRARVSRPTIVQRGQRCGFRIDWA